MDRPLSVTVLRCRTSDRTPGGALGAEALGARAGPCGAAGRDSGRSADRRDWEDDLRDSRGCLLEAGGQVDDLLAAGAASRC